MSISRIRDCACDIHPYRGVAAATFAAWMLILTAGATAADTGKPAGPKNLISRPGFEASEAALRTVWHSPGAGVAVDRIEKHTGNQSLRLTAAGQGPGAAVSCALSVQGLATPTTLLISGWSKARGITGTPDNAYAIYIDVNFADGTNLYGPNAAFSTGTHDWEYREVKIALPKPATRISVNLLLRGNHAGTAWFDDLYAASGTEDLPRYDGDPLAYTIPPRVDEARRQVAGLRKKIDALEELIKTAELRGIDAACPKVSLTVARLFAYFIPQDAELEVGDYPADMIDYQIVGRPETLRRIEQLAAFETRETERLLDRALDETRQLLAEPARQLRIPSGRLRDITARNGAFHCGDRPVFISGILGMPFTAERNQLLEVVQSLGANLVGPAHVSHGCTRGWDQFDDADFDRHVLPLYRAAEAKGLLVNPALWNYRAPAWLAKLAPDIDLDDGHGWFRDCLDLEHPLTERFHRSWFRYAAQRLKRRPNNFCYSLMGEEWCDPGYRGKYTTDRYVEWLKAKHKDLATLNRAWGTDYRDFAAAAGKDSAKTRGGRYDWYAFNEDRLTRFNQAQIDGLKAADPDGLWTCWPAAGCLVSAPLGGFDPQYGRNREDILRQSSVSGWDGGIFAVEAGASTRRLPESHWAKYSLGWRDEMVYYDFAKSLSPEKPIFDPELHTLTSVYHLSPLGVPADYFRTTLWMEHLHGLGAHLVWWWGRHADGTPRFGEFLGGLLTQPQLLDAWGRTVLELRRLTDYVVLFPQLERKVRILYSEASAIHDGKAYPLQVRDAYEALYFLDYPVGFVTERMVQEGKLTDCRLLVIPAAKHVQAATVAKIHEYQQGGGRLVLIGADGLKCDEYGNARTPDGSLAAESLRLGGTTPEEYAPQLDRLLDQAGVSRPVRLAGPDGKRTWGVELRTAMRGDKRIVYLINVTRQPLAVTLRGPRLDVPARDLVQDSPLSLAAPLVIEPRQPRLIELAP